MWKVVDFRQLCVWCRQFQVSFFGGWFLISLVSFIEGPFPGICPGKLVINQLITQTWIYFCLFWSVCLVHVPAFVPILYFFGACNLNMQSESELTQAVLSFFRVALALWGPFWFHINDRVLCSVSLKHATLIVLEIELNVYTAQAGWTFDNMLPMHDHKIFFLFTVFFFSFFISVLQFSLCMSFVQFITRCRE